MGFIGCHPNIVNLVGAYTKNILNREIYIAIEYCENGSLLAYLRDNRQRYKNFVDPAGEFIADAVITEESFVYPGREGLTTITLMKIAEEVASGMEFLSSKKVIHGDLAAYVNDVNLDPILNQRDYYKEIHIKFNFFVCNNLFALNEYD